MEQLSLLLGVMFAAIHSILPVNVSSRNSNRNEFWNFRSSEKNRVHFLCRIIWNSMLHSNRGTLGTLGKLGTFELFHFSGDLLLFYWFYKLRVKLYSLLLPTANDY